MRTVEIRRGECDVYVEGMDMPCPLCSTLVRSGQRHHCKATEEPITRKVGRALHQPLHERVSK